MKSDDRALSCPCRALPSREPARGTNRYANKHGARILRISPPRKKAPERLPFCVVRDKAVNAARTVFADKREGRAGSREGVARRFAERTPLGFRQIPAISTVP